MKYLIAVLVALAMVSCDESEMDLTELEIKTEISLIGEWNLTEHIWKATLTDKDGNVSYIYNYEYNTPNLDITICIDSETTGLYKYGDKSLPFNYSIKNDIFAISEIYTNGKTPYHLTLFDTMKVVDISDYVLKCINPIDTTMKMVFVNELID